MYDYSIKVGTEDPSVEANREHAQGIFFGGGGWGGGGAVGIPVFQINLKNPSQKSKQVIFHKKMIKCHA